MRGTVHLERHGIPRTPRDLKRHEFVVYTLTPDRYLLPLTKGGRRRTVKLAATVETNSGRAMRRMVLAGTGMGVMPAFYVDCDLRLGKLEKVLPSYEVSRKMGLYAVYPANRHLLPKVRAFLDFVAEKFKDPRWDR